METIRRECGGASSSYLYHPLFEFPSVERCQCSIQLKEFMMISAPAAGCRRRSEESPPPEDPPPVASNSAAHLAKSPSLPSAADFHRCVLTLRGHSSYVSALAAHGGADSLYSGSSDGEVRSWDLGGGDGGRYFSSRVVAACGSAVKCLVVRGGRMFTAHQDRKIHVWQIGGDGERRRGAYKLAHTLPTAGDRLLSLLSPERYVEVRRHKKCTWVNHADAVAAIALSHDGTLLYSASWDRTFKVWRASDGKCLESSANAHHDAINAIAVSGDGFVYTGSADTAVKVWKRRPAEKRHVLVATLERRHRSTVNALALSPDGSVLYSGGCDGAVAVWEGGGEGSSPHMVLAGALRGHTGAVLCLATVAELVCSGSADRSVRVWRRTEDRSCVCLAVLDGHRGPVKCIAPAPAEEGREDLPGSGGGGGGVFRRIYTGSLDCDIRIWRVYVPRLGPSDFPAEI